MSASRRILRLFAYTRPYLGRLIVALVALFIAGGLGLIFPRVLGMVVDAAFTTQDRTQLDRTALFLVAIFAVQAAFTWVRHYYMSWVGERVVADIRVEIQRHLLRLSQEFFQGHRIGELVSRLGDDVARLQDVVGQDLSLFLRNLLALVGGIAILLWINLYLTTVMLGVVPPLVLIAAYFGRVLRRISRESQTRLANASGTLAEGLSGIEVVQAFTREDFEAGRYREAIDHAFALFEKKISARASFMAGASFLAFSALAGIFWLGSTMVIEGRITSGELASFFFYTMAVGSAVGSMSALYGRLTAAIGSTERIFEILDTPPTLADRPDAVPLPEPVGDLVYQEVHFAYPGHTEPVVSGLSLKVAPGEVCALVGPSGAGKTTVARLALRFWDPTEGSVTLDGHDLRELRLADLRGAMALVSQDPLLFSGSLRENIRYGRLEATDEEVEAAARAANADEFIRQLPQGYDTPVGERGIKLSGGQRQRVSIARAILRDPRVLILDEATSALDTESEALVQEALEKLQAGRTTLVIAHRLSTVRSADRILVLEGGVVVEEGTHDQLLARDGAYARLVNRQRVVGEVSSASAPA